VRTLPKIRAFYDAFYDSISGATGSAAAEDGKGEAQTAEAKRASRKYLTSFDGCSALRGGEHKQVFAQPWSHVDRNARRTPNLHDSVQCAVNFVKGTPSANGGFVLVPRSHRAYDAAVASTDPATKATMAAFLKPNKHYLGLTDSMHPLLRAARQPDGSVSCVALAVEAGDMVCWDSSLVHANTSPTTSAVRGQLRRLAAYVSFLPADRVPVSKKFSPALRLEAAAKGATASHDPSNATENNHPVYPRPKTFQPVLTPPACLRTLASFLPEELALLS